MSQASYEYDENSETWPYFVLTAVLVPLVPATLSTVASLIAKGDRDSKYFKDIRKTWAKPYNLESINQFKQSLKTSKLVNKFNGFLLFGWILVLSLVIKICNIELLVSETNFDPWKILDISESATDKVIKASYRKLSLKYHPDKVDTSSMSQSEIDAVDAAYVLINKAYKALTDETVRENFLKYGNPDGPNEIKHGIALPKFLIDGPTSPLLVLLYVLLLAVILPLLISNWWNGVKSMTKQDIHVNSAHYFMKTMINASPTKVLLVDDILKHISKAEEFQNIDKNLSPEDVYKQLISFINREKSDNDQLRLKIVSVAPKLLIAFIDIAAAFKNTDYCLKIVDTHRSILQALNTEKDSKHYRFKEILQLPGTDASKIDSKQNILTLGKLLKKPTVKPAEFLNVNDSESKNILDYAKSIPLIEPLECKFDVPGEDFVPPASTAFINMKFIVKSPAQKSKPELKNFKKDVIESQFTEHETMESLRDPLKIVNDQPLLKLDNILPYFPDDEYVKSNSGWVAFLVSQRDNKIIEIPQFIKRCDTSNLALSQDEYMKSECNISTFKLQLQAPTPKTPGEFQFRLVIRNLVYFGSDLDIPLVMKVEDKPMEKTDEKVYEIEDPEEDSLAGAIATIKGEKVKKIEFENEYDSSEDEDEEDSESEDNSWTDIDTDTEVEEDAIDDK